ncbi:hypothetical protein T484DRAFT_1861657 [Baffinella frigidus]|nr:hypothetical protein T484DRAFT_1861657 [Cryptophyta sp. CCMP2293]
MNTIGNSSTTEMFVHGPHRRQHTATPPPVPLDVSLGFTPTRSNGTAPSEARRYALARDAIICTMDLQPTIHLNGWVFALESKPYEEGTALFLRFPLEQGTSEFRHLPPDAIISRERQATFLPSSHGLNYATLDHDSAPRILMEAGISNEAMSRWISSHLSGASDDDMARWKLMALTHVREHWHLPTVDLLLYDTASDEDEPPNTPGYFAKRRYVTSLDRIWKYPRVQVHIASQPGTAPNPGLESTSYVNASIDIMAPFPLMSRSFALRARIDLSALDTVDAGFLFELRPGLGRMHQLGSSPHFTRYWGLGFTTETPVRPEAPRVAAQGELRPWRVSKESLPGAIRSGEDDGAAPDSNGVGGAALLSAKAASALATHGTIFPLIAMAIRLQSPTFATPVVPTAPALLHNAPLNVPSEPVSAVDVISSRAPPGGAGDPDRDDKDPDGDDPGDHDVGPTSVEWQTLPAQRAMDSSSFALTSHAHSSTPRRPAPRHAGNVAYAARVADDTARTHFADGLVRGHTGFGLTTST